MRENLSRIVRTTTRGHVIVDVWQEPVLGKSPVEWTYSVHLGSSQVDRMTRFSIVDLPDVIVALLQALISMSRDQIAKPGQKVLTSICELWKP